MGAYSSLVLSHASLRAYYRLGEGSGTTLVDAGPNGLTGTYAGSGVTYGAAGAIQDGDTAVTFAGSSDAATVPDNNALDLADGPFSLECWIKRSATQGAAQGLISKTADPGYVLYISVFNTVALTKLGSAAVVSGTTAITDTTTWHHIVATKNGSARKFYIDGVDRTSLGTDQTLGDNTSVLRIGHQSATTNRFPGSMDEVAIYGAVLSATEVLDHYNRGRGLLFLADTATASEAVAKAPRRNIADTASSGDAVAKATGKALADSATPAESRVEATGKTQADSVTPTDAATKAPRKVIADTATPSDATAKTAGHPLSDSASPTDALSKAPGPHLADSVTPSDATSRLPGKGIADSVTASDSRVSGAGVVRSEIASISDALTTAEGNFVALGDSVTVTDQVSPALLHDFTQAVGDAVTVADSVVLVASGTSGTTPGGGVLVPVFRTRVVTTHRPHFNDSVLAMDDLQTDRAISDLRREEELSLALI